MNNKADIMEGKLIGIIIIVIFLIVAIGIYLAVKGRINTNISSIFDFF